MVTTPRRKNQGGLLEDPLIKNTCLILLGVAVLLAVLKWAKVPQVDGSTQSPAWVYTPPPQLPPTPPAPQFPLFPGGLR